MTRVKVEFVPQSPEVEPFKEPRVWDGESQRTACRSGKERQRGGQ